LSAIYLSEAQKALSQRRFSEAQSKTQQALATAGTPDKLLEVESKRVLGLAQSFSGQKRAGRQLCEEALVLATQVGDTELNSAALLSLAETALEDGDARKAQELALQVQKQFAPAEQLASEWRAWLIAARASQSVGDMIKARAQAQEALNSLSRLQQRWGTEVFNTYLARPDVSFTRKQLSQFEMNN
jgi:tetratricopeptide (TPR) repeat protein